MLGNIEKIAASILNRYALDSNGTVWAWGYGFMGGLGNGSFNDIIATYAQPVFGLTGIVDIAAGGDFCLALRADGTVWAWGNNWEGDLGDEQRSIGVFLFKLKALII